MFFYDRFGIIRIFLLSESNKSPCPKCYFRPLKLISYWSGIRRLLNLRQSPDCGLMDTEGDKLMTNLPDKDLVYPYEVSCSKQAETNMRVSLFIGAFKKPYTVLKSTLKFWILSCLPYVLVKRSSRFNEHYIFKRGQYRYYLQTQSNDRWGSRRPIGV